MTKREIATVACRLVALAMMAFGCVTLARPLGMRLAGASLVRFDNAVPVVVGIAWLILSVYIWSRAENYAARMLDDDPVPVTSPGLTAEDILSLGTAVIGIWLAGPALAALINLVIEWGPDLANDDSSSLSRAHLAVFGPTIAQLLIGIWCMLGSRAIAGMLQRVRTAGTAAAARLTHGRDSRFGDAAVRGHDWGIIALRLTAIYLFIQALLWGGSMCFALLALFAEFDNVVENPWNLLRVLASAASPTLLCYLVARRYWKAAPRMTAPIHVTNQRPNIADERIAPILIAALSLWGMVNLIPAVRSVVWESMSVGDFEATFTASELVDDMQRFEKQYQRVAFVVAAVAALGSRSIVAALIYAKRSISHRRVFDDASITSAK